MGGIKIVTPKNELVQSKKLVECLGDYISKQAGYIDRKVYDENPLTLKDFRKHLGKEKANKFDEEVRTKMKATMKALSNLRDANSVARQRGVSIDKVFNG